MNKSFRSQLIAGTVLSLAGVAGTLTLHEGSYNIITLLGIMFLLIAFRSKSSA